MDVVACSESIADGGVLNNCEWWQFSVNVSLGIDGTPHSHQASVSLKSSPLGIHYTEVEQFPLRAT